METKSHSLILSDRLNLVSNWKILADPARYAEINIPGLFHPYVVGVGFFFWGLLYHASTHIYYVFQHIMDNRGLLYHASTHIYYVFQHIMDNRVTWKIQL
jgi:hypothetical protein